MGPCLEALAAQTRPPDEILFVDDHSGDRSVEIARRHPVRVLHQPRWLGLAAARNRALKEARGEIIVFVDVDTRPRPDLIEAFMGRFDRPEVGAVAGQGLEVGGSSWVDRWRRTFWVQTQGPEPLSRTRVLSGLCCSFRLSALRTIAGFDPSYPTNGEDIDAGLRLIRAGWTVAYEPRAIVEHHRRDNPASLVRMTFRHTFWHCRALRRNGFSAHQVRVNSLKWLPVSLGSSLRRHGSPGLAAISALAGSGSILGWLAEALTPDRATGSDFTAT